MGTDRICDLNLHDSAIKEIVIHRAGDRIDTVAFRLEYIEDYKTAETTNRILEFSGCFSFRADLNFGYAPPDSILEATVVSQSELVQKVEKSFGRMTGKPQSLDLKHYRIETSTTGSVIDIVARDFKLTDPK
jgi:hypothetical protein